MAQVIESLHGGGQTRSCPTCRGVGANPKCLDEWHQSDLDREQVLARAALDRTAITGQLARVQAELLAVSGQRTRLTSLRNALMRLAQS